MASNISFSGIGSGIDFNSVRDAIINQRSRPLNLLQSKANNYNSRVEALKKLNGLLATLTTATQDLTSRQIGTGRSAAVADSTVAIVTANSGAGLGNINLDVARLASNFTQASRSFSSTSAPILVGGTSATFELRKGGETTGTPITIDSANNSLAGLRDAINAADAGVTASIIDLKGDGTEQQLVLNSRDTGGSGRVELVETSSTGTGADVNLRSLNPPDNDFSKLDAVFSINGLSVTRSSNNVSDAVTGLSIALKKIGATTIEIKESSEIEEKLDSFIKAYNDVQDFFAEQYKKDGQNRPTGILAGDSALRNVQQQVGTITGISSASNGGTLDSLTQIGITTDKSGKLSLDKTVLNERLEDDSSDVRSLLYGKTATDTGIFQAAYALSNNLSDNITGSVQTAINGYQSSVKNINDTIASRTEILNRLRDSLTRQFAAADAAIGQLNGQNSSLSNLIKTLQSNSN